MSVGEDIEDIDLESYMFLDQATSFRNRLKDELKYLEDDNNALKAANDQVGSMRNLVNWWRELDSKVRSYCISQEIEIEKPDISDQNSGPVLNYRKAVAALQNANNILKEKYSTDLREITERELEYGKVLYLDRLDG